MDKFGALDTAGASSYATAATALAPIAMKIHCTANHVSSFLITCTPPWRRASGDRLYPRPKVREETEPGCCIPASPSAISPLNS